MKNFKRIDADIDGEKLIKTINAIRLTKKRMKLIQSYARYHSQPITRCHHEHDCCGCVCYRNMDIEYSYPFITLVYTIGINV